MAHRATKFAQPPYKSSDPRLPGRRRSDTGEEIGNEGRAFAHFVTGTEAGHSYELAWLGNMSYENQLANPHTGDKTVVALTDDGRPSGGRSG
jgi:hypothetical protein